MKHLINHASSAVRQVRRAYFISIFWCYIYKSCSLFRIIWGHDLIVSPYPFHVLTGAVDIASMSDFHNRDQQHIILNLVKDAIYALTDAITFLA